MNCFPAASACQDRRKTHTVFDAEQLMLAWIAQVGVDQKRALAELGKDNGKIGGDETPPFSGL